MKPYVPVLVAFAAATFAPAIEAAPTLRFTTTAPGGIVGTGNTLGLSKDTGVNGPGTRDSIGTFLSLDPNSVDNMPVNASNPWPMGTTSDWKANGSSAELDLPEAEVLYAELLWGGSYQYGTEDVSADLNSPVSLTANGSTIMVNPSAATPMTLSGTSSSSFAIRYYMRSADVTDFVKQAGKGTYSVSGVPATQIETINSLNAAGWTLVVAYRDEGAPMRNLSVFVGGSFVDEGATQDYPVSGFCAPPAGTVGGNIVVSTIEGDANLPGDVLQIAPTLAGPFVDLSGPNNPANNFFCSQINDSNGMLDTRGTAGNVNHAALANPPVNVIGGRQGWDITTVGLSSQANQLQNGQTSAVIRTKTLQNGDSYAPILVAFAIDVNAPNFTGAASSALDAPANVAQNESFLVTATLVNNGDVAAQDIQFSLPLEDSLGLATFAVDGKPGDVNGNLVDAAKLGAGVSVGGLAKGQTKTITIDLNVLGAPKFGSFFLKAKWDYGFEVCAGQPLVPESYTQTKLVGFVGGGSSSSSGAGGGGGAGGAGTGGANSGGNGGAGGSVGEGGSGGSDPTGGGDTGDTGSCACTVAGGGDRSLPILPALGFLSVFAARRTRRRSR